MKTPATSHWNEAYLSIAKLESRPGLLNLVFENGDDIDLPITSLQPPKDAQLDWYHVGLSEDGLEIIVPGNPVDFSIPADLIRRLTDDDFRAAMNEHAEQQARLIGKELRHLREQRGLTQARLAHLAGVLPGNLSRIENGAFDISSSMLLRLLSAMSCTPADLAISAPTPPPPPKRPAAHLPARAAAHKKR